MDFPQIISHILKAPFVSILSDGSTDRAVIEQEIVYLHYVDQCMPTTRMINLISLESEQQLKEYSKKN